MLFFNITPIVLSEDEVFVGSYIHHRHFKSVKVVLIRNTSTTIPPFNKVLLLIISILNYDFFVIN